MKIEEEIFTNQYKIDNNKLIHYGFKQAGNKLVFENIFFDSEFKVIIDFQNKFSGKIIDLTANEEYTNFRVENSNGFSSEIRQKYIDILKDIRDKCSQKQTFQSKQGECINKYITEKYHDMPEFLWKNLPTYAIFRNKKNKKWYAIIGTVQVCKVNKASKSTKIIEVMNLKTDKDKIKDLLNINGIYEAYHMNKKNWISIILDETVENPLIFNLIDDSYKNIM